jgi:hypothetical protein
MGQETIPSEATVVASSRQVSTDVEGEAVILNFDEGVYYGLDKVGARIWELLRSPLRVSELRDKIVAEYGVPPDQCEADLRALLSELAEAGLVDVADASSA